MNSEDLKQDEVPSNEETSAELRQAERRRFLKAGLIAAPFIMTLAARPARAQAAMGSLGNYEYGDPGNNDDAPHGKAKGHGTGQGRVRRRGM